MRRDADITLLSLLLFIPVTLPGDVFSDCGEPAPSANTYRTIYNSSVEYKCLDNYFLRSGNLTRDCVDGSFTGTPPVCTLSCGSPLNSSYADITNNGTEAGSVVTYSCSQDSLVTMTTTVCDANEGYWLEGDLCFDNTTLNMSSFTAVQSSTALKDVVLDNSLVSTSVPDSEDVALFAAGNAIDTNTNANLLSGGCSSTALEGRPRITITMDGYYSIYQIAVTLPVDDFAKSLPNLHIKSSGTLETMYDCEKNTDVIPKGSRYTAICKRTRYPAWGKYIEIVTDFGTETGMLQICDVEIFARPLSSVDCGQPFERRYAVRQNNPSVTHLSSNGNSNKVYYSCMEGYIVKSGRDYGNCNVNGDWKSNLVCTDDENLSSAKNVWLATNPSEMLPSLTDFNTSSCFVVPNVTEATFIIDLEDETEISDVSVNFYDVGSIGLPNISVGVWRENKTVNACEQFTMQSLHGNTGNVGCEKNPVGKYLSVRVFYDDISPLEICEFMVHGRRFSEALECYLQGEGVEYKGRMKMTVTGIPCQRWDSQTPHAHNDNDVSKFPDDSLRDAANFCRNPDGKYSLWCYTTDPDVPWQYCPVKQCDVICLRDERGSKYKGYVRTTSTGKGCVRWDSENIPFKATSHFTNLPKHPVYCRNPLESQSRPWCYTTDDASAYGLCSIPTCPTTSDLNWGHWIMDTDQTLSDLLPSQECYVWTNVFTNESSRATRYTYGFTVAKICPVGQVFNTTVLCVNMTDYGTVWKTGILECVHCGAPPAVDNATVFAPSRHLSGVAKYTCVSGYGHASGSDSITCLKSGQWENPDMICLVDCGPPPDVVKTNWTIYSSLENSTAEYTCFEGYAHVSGSAQITCQRNGNWSTTTINCLIDCGYPPSVNNTSVATVNTTLNGIAMYSCDARYVHVTGSTNVTCSETGVWNEPTIQCLVDCGPPPDVVHANVTLNSSLENGTAWYTCSEGYEHVSGSTQIACQRNGNWSTTTINCLIDCVDPPRVPNATFTTSGTWSGSTALYRCDVGYVQVSGSVDISCLQNGTWEHPSIVCEVLATNPLSTLLQTTTPRTILNVTDRYGRYRYQSCICRCIPKPRKQKEIILSISNSLLLNTKELISYTMTKESLPDERPTSHGMAYLAMSLIVALFAVVFVSDFYYCYAGSRRYFQAKQNCK